MENKNYKITEAMISEFITEINSLTTYQYYPEPIIQNRFGCQSFYISSTVPNLRKAGKFIQKKIFLIFENSQMNRFYFCSVDAILYKSEKYRTGHRSITVDDFEKALPIYQKLLEKIKQ